MTERGLIVPITAVKGDDSGSYVLVVDQAEDDGLAGAPQTRRVAVEARTSAYGRVLVDGDLTEGELVVVGELTRPVIEALGLCRTYENDGRTVEALRSVSIAVDPGECVAVVGPSGAGKSTLLNVLGLLDEPSGGEYRLLGHDTRRLSGRKRDELRRDAIGFVFQAYHILANRTVWDNFRLKLSVAGVDVQQRRGLIQDVLESVGLDDQPDALGRHLSGGEKQRLAIARAVVGRPALVLADEPTGNLDAGNADTVLQLLGELAADRISVVVITHDDRTAAWADRVLTLESGRMGDS